MRQILFAFFSLISSTLCADTLLRTETHYFRPFVTGEQKPSYEITMQLRGSCLSQSAIIVREDAWRCVSAGKILEPCFSQSQDTRSLLCFEHPRYLKAILLKLDAPLPMPPLVSLDMSSTYPWEIELESGERCESVKGLAPIDGQAVNYRCEDGSFLLAHVQRCKQPWRILHKTSQLVSNEQIRAAWF